MGRSMAANLLALCLLLLGTATAQTSQKHPLSNLPPPAEDIDTQVWVPERPGLNFPAGEAVDFIVGMHNGGSEDFNVSAIFGSLNHPQQFNTFFYNFSGQGYGQSMGAGEEVSLSYTVYLPPQLPPREFQVALTVFYNTPTGGYASTFFNRTVDIIEPPSYIDTQLLFLWLLLLAGLGSAGYAVWHYVQQLPYMRKANIKRAKASKYRASQQPKREANPEEWLQGTNFAKGAKQPPRRKLSQKDLQKAAATTGGQL